MSSAFSLRAVRELFPLIKVAVISGSGGRDETILALQAGVHGYVPKTLGVAEITRAIQMILNGDIYVPATLAELPLQALAMPPQAPSQPLDTTVRLTPRQQDVLGLIRCGASNKEIAKKLGLTDNTVKVHANALYRALGVRSRYGAAKMVGSP